jgi:hypothetical protein
MKVSDDTRARAAANVPHFKHSYRIRLQGMKQTDIGASG